MKEPRSENERLSALLDGRLDERERGELLAHLSAVGEEYRVFADTVSILRELEEAEAGAEAGCASSAEGIRLRPRRPGWRRPVWWATAASVVLFAQSAVLASRVRAFPAGDLLRLAERVEPAGAGLPNGWAERERPWGRTRGGDASSDSWCGEGEGERPRDERVQAARVGVLLLELAVAMRARDGADTRLLAREVRNRFGEKVADASLREIEERAGAPPASLAPLLMEAAERLSDQLDVDYLRLGAWMGAAQLATHRQNDAFFRDRESRAMIRHAEQLTRSDARASRADGVESMDVFEGCGSARHSYQARLIRSTQESE